MNENSANRVCKSGLVLANTWVLNKGDKNINITAVYWTESSLRILEIIRMNMGHVTENDDLFFL